MYEIRLFLLIGMLWFSLAEVKSQIPPYVIDVHEDLIVTTIELSINENDELQIEFDGNITSLANFEEDFSNYYSVRIRDFRVFEILRIITAFKVNDDVLMSDFDKLRSIFSKNEMLKFFILRVMLKTEGF